MQLLHTMEVAIHVVEAAVRDAQRFKLCCKVQAVGPGDTREVYEGSASVTQPVISSTTDRPKITFSLASKPTQLSLLFVAMSSRQGSTCHLGKKLGRCEGSLSTATSAQLTQTLLIRRHIPGTNVEQFAGKLTYTVHLSKAVGADFTSLLTDEANRSCVHVLPSHSPFVTVVFHCAYSSLDPTQYQLVGVARIGERSDISVDTLLQESSQQPHQVSLLKTTTLSCQEFDCLELHIVDMKSSVIFFSSTRAIHRLTPFKPIHYKYDGRNHKRTCGGENSWVPSVSISVKYTPCLSEYDRYEGLEIAVCDISLSSSIGQCRNVVMGTQLVQRDSKMKAPALDGHSFQPPFQLHTKKGKAPTSNSKGQHDYHLTVLQCNGKEIVSSIKSYFIFPYSSPSESGADLVFHIYGSSGAHMWWITESCTSAQLEISEHTITMLREGEIPCICWKVSSKDSVQVCRISGVMRWKTKQAQFFTKESVRGALGGPTRHSNSSSLASLNGPTSTELDQSTRPELVYPTSIQQTLEGLAMPTEETDVYKGRNEAIDVLSQLMKEVESNLHHMVSDNRLLRREKQRLQEENQELQLQMAKVKSLVSPRTLGDIGQLSKSDLILRIDSLQQALESEEGAHERYQERIHVLQNDLSARQDLEAQHVELQEVHTVQQKLVELLRGKVAKYHKCSNICKNQESVITQLESLLAKQAEGHPSAKNDAISLLSRENTELRALVQQYQASGDYDQQAAALVEKEQVIRLLKSHLSQLASHCQTLEQQRARNGTRNVDKREIDARVFELEQRLLVAEAKLSAQTSQLQENTEKWMLERAHYELQLADFQSRLNTVVRSGQHALSKCHATNPTIESQQAREDHMQHYSSGKTNTKDYSF